MQQIDLCNRNREMQRNMNLHFKNFRTEVREILHFLVNPKRNGDKERSSKVIGPTLATSHDDDRPACAEHVAGSKSTNQQWKDS